MNKEQRECVLAKISSELRAKNSKLQASVDKKYYKTIAPFEKKLKEAKVQREKDAKKAGVVDVYDIVAKAREELVFLGTKVDIAAFVAKYTK
jgi:hypothetical protein